MRLRIAGYLEWHTGGIHAHFANNPLSMSLAFLGLRPQVLRLLIYLCGVENSFSWFSSINGRWTMGRGTTA